MAKRALVKYSQDNNFNIVDFYTETGISGEEIENRPELVRLLNDIDCGKVNKILVFKIDRLGRTVSTNSKIANILRKKHCTITSSDFGIFDFTQATYQFIYNMLSSVSQFEVNNLSERVINGKKKRVKLGLYLNSYNVYGYDNKYDELCGTRLLKINEFESIIVNRIYDLYLNGLSMNKIAIQLQKENIPCKRGGKWRQSTISQILKNKLYIGKVIYNGNSKATYIEQDGIHEKIIDEDIFSKVQELILKREGFKVKKIPNEYSYFSPILNCSICGGKFKGKQTKSKNKNSVRYYCCNKDCSSRGIPHELIEKLFENELCNIKLQYNQNIIELCLNNDEYKRTASTLESLIKKQKELDEKFNSNNLNLDIYNRQISKLDDKISVITNRKIELENTLIVLDKNIEQVIKNTMSSVKDSFIKLSNSDRQNFINLFIEKIEVNFINGKVVIENLKWKYKNQCS